MNEQEKINFEKPALDWQNCQQGEIGKVSSFLKRRRRRHTVSRAVTVGAILLAVGGLGWFALIGNEPGGRQIAGLHCNEVFEHTDELFQGELNPGAVDQITAHLEACPGCVLHMEEVRVEFENRTGQKAKYRFNPEPEVAAEAHFEGVSQLVSLR
ncbi:hypothetical protein Pla110_40230 [Polystyrenella longa]|uniref:Zinc-finger domain-containing protein n=1 Tax=Polystyrenella longa TaxID=2528007 RepID=A0A518CSS4_9PLAN|nr:hypothetical protein [Polystyrenella longa]QDU82268.1 hypothetical protein Pla110_40230 [Polystyrenella longa]